MLQPHRIVENYDRLVTEWHRSTEYCVSSLEELDLLLEQHHRANFDLWHAEDEARSPRATDATLAETKRSIDRFNQRRNDLIEKIDATLLQAIQKKQLPIETAPLHSETPGLILDRLSILSLKRFHTEEQILRNDVDQAHRERNHQRLQTLSEQTSDLTTCLVSLWSEVLGGTRRFKLYRQLKMYNDPSLNPAIYRNAPR